MFTIAKRKKHFSLYELFMCIYNSYILGLKYPDLRKSVYLNEDRRESFVEILNELTEPNIILNIAKLTYLMVGIKYHF